MFDEKIKALNGEAVPAQQPVEDAKRTYTVDEIQDILGISRPSAYNLIKQNEFRSVRIGGHIRVSKRSFDLWLDTEPA